MNSKLFLLARAKRVHFNHAAQQLGDVGVYLYLFARKRIALLATYLTLLHSTKIKLSKKCQTERCAKPETQFPDFIHAGKRNGAFIWEIFIPPTYDLRKFKRDLGKRASSPMI